MTDEVKARSNMILDSLKESADESESLAAELVQMLMRGEYDGRLTAQVRKEVNDINEAVTTIHDAIDNLTLYVNRKQQTHRL